MTEHDSGAKALSDNGVKVPGFWVFSLALYARPGVAEACLALQDRFGADVNLLLLGFWRTARGLAVWDGIELAHAQSAVAPVNAVLQPFREARRALKALVAEEPAAGRLYDEARALELKLEQVAQAWLAAVSRISPAQRRPLPLARAEAVTTAAAHLSAYLELIAPDNADALPLAADLLAAALKED